MVINNTQWELYDYNCGGFALGVEEWAPEEDWEDRPSDRKFVRTILAQYPYLRPIRHLEDLTEQEDLILARVGYHPRFAAGWDYHFVRVTCHGAFHKAGGSKPKPFPTKRLFHDWINKNGAVYGGKIHMFAIDKSENSWYTINEIKEEGSALQWLKKNQKSLKVRSTKFRSKLKRTPRQVG